MGVWANLQKAGEVRTLVLKMPRPILTLTSGFGVSDHYVGTMKGIILGICPQAQIVDVSHDVTPFAIAEGAYLIAQAYRYFPKKTVHVLVVDPGVGSALPGTPPYSRDPPSRRCHRLSMFLCPDIGFATENRWYPHDGNVRGIGREDRNRAIAT